MVTVFNTPRGGQVTVGLVWRNYWRGPTVVINAGSLTSKTPIPMGVFPVMVTAEYDYFHTKDQKYVHKQFEKLSEVPGMLFHLPVASHKAERLHLYICRIANLTIRREARLRNWSDEFPNDMGTAEASHQEELEPGKPAFAVVSNANQYKQTILRARNTSEPDWLVDGSKGVIVNDGEVVLVTGMGHAGDDTHKHMYTVQRNSAQPEGWIYSWNVVPKGSKSDVSHMVSG
jgi:hypothetical protein